MRKPTRLGRGLDELMKGNAQAKDIEDKKPIKRVKSAIAKQNPSKSSGVSHAMQIITLDKVFVNPNQPRKSFDQRALSVLAESIKLYGLMQPLVVRASADGYELVAGERRLRACRIIKLKEVPVIVRDVDEEESSEMALVENLHREDLNPIEKAEALHKLIESYGVTQAELGRRVGLERATITNLLRLLDLGEVCKELVIRGALKMGHARALASVTEEELQKTLAMRAVSGEWSVRRVEQEVARLQQGEPLLSKESKKQNPHLALLEKELSQKLGAKVRIQGRKKGSGTLSIDYTSVDHFESLMERLQVDADV